MLDPWVLQWAARRAPLALRELQPEATAHLHEPLTELRVRPEGRNFGLDLGIGKVRGALHRVDETDDEDVLRRPEDVPDEVDVEPRGEIRPDAPRDLVGLIDEVARLVQESQELARRLVAHLVSDVLHVEAEHRIGVAALGYELREHARRGGLRRRSWQTEATGPAGCVHLEAMRPPEEHPVAMLQAGARSFVWHRLPVHEDAKHMGSWLRGHEPKHHLVVIPNKDLAQSRRDAHATQADAAVAATAHNQGHTEFAILAERENQHPSELRIEGQVRQKRRATKCQRSRRDALVHRLHQEAPAPVCLGEVGGDAGLRGPRVSVGPARPGVLLQQALPTGEGLPRARRGAA
mmetsp:Transcript_30466/g.101273  ORF Transcript_30466/g.101273 Transcript_30466/m.101273 type:complete len:349 (-) Transcript_30466:504-1550(-)